MIAPYPADPRYGVTQKGEVFRVTPSNMGKAVPYALRPVRHTQGYFVVSVGGRWRFVHRMVAETFLPPPSPEKEQVGHLDGTRTNNAVENLYWCTPKENSGDMIRHGRSLRGEKHHRAKLTATEVVQIRHALAGGATLHELADAYGVVFQTISDIKRRRRWKHLPENLNK